MDKVIINTCKDYINTNQNEEFKAYVYETIIFPPEDYRIPYEYIFQKVYIHACLKQNTILATWLKDEIYTNYFDSIQKIGLRQTFSYGNYLLYKGNK